MHLCIDLGNARLKLGVFKQKDFIFSSNLQYAKTTNVDELCNLLKDIFHKNNIDFKDIKQISICSVCPKMDIVIKQLCIDYFALTPIFLDYTKLLGFEFNYNIPSKIGADRLANALAVANLKPNKNIIIIDLGTAITFCALTKERKFHAGPIIPGITSMAKSLTNDTEKLSDIDISKPENMLGYNTKDNILLGIFYGIVGAIEKNKSILANKLFKNEKFLVIATGGDAELFSNEKIFDIIINNLPLLGLNFMHLIKK